MTGKTCNFICSIDWNSVPGRVFHDILGREKCPSPLHNPVLILGETGVYLGMFGFHE
jgi:hypothetical protein